MTRALLISKDLMFTAKVREVAAATGSEVVTARSLEGVEKALGEAIPITLLLIDLEKSGAPLESLAERCAGVISSGGRVVSFFSHVHEEVATRAEALGLGEVMPRSRFVRLLPDLFASV